MIQKSRTKYVIARKWEYDKYLDKYDCEIDDIYEAQFYDTYEEAREYKDNIDVAYLYEVYEVHVNYTIIEY